ncbi:MAG: TIGR02221 family CRISPR-associated protein [Lachnospiraceae bacterium]|nr:TIGR02221 family CRISPR-associated protein [Lachnospiraceae bacterium]
MRKFISCLGFSDYKQTCYYMGDKDHASETRFVQKAILDLMPEEEKPQKIFIATTPEAYERNWISKDGVDGLEAELKRAYPDIESGHFMIPRGENEKEIWELFRTVLEYLEEGDEVIADITHAFRFIPMIMITILNYAKTVKNITVKNIYYGQFDSKNTHNPVLSLKLYDQLLDWTQATNTFLRYGNSRDFTAMATRDMNKKKRESTSREEQNSASDINKLSKALDMFTSSISTCRGGIYPKGDQSIMQAYHKLDEALERVIQKDNQSLEPLNPLLEIIKKKTEIFRTAQTENAYKMMDTGMAACQWCIDKDMIPMALTAMAETITTYVCIQLGCSEKADDKKFRENIGSSAVAYAIAGMKKTDFKFNDNLTEEQRNLIRSAGEKLSRDFVRLAEQIKSLRNDVNHFGLSDNTNSSTKILEKTKTYFKELSRMTGWEEKTGE